MMVKSLTPGFLLLILCLVFFSSGCSHVVYPTGPIPVQMDVVGAMDVKKAVSFTNAATDSGVKLIATHKRRKYFADYKQWTGFVVSQLEEELKKRGVRVRPGGEIAFRVNVESIGLFWGAFASRCILRVRVERADRTWAKTFEGNNASGRRHVNRAATGAVHRAIVSILEDRDFQTVMR